MTSQTRRTDPMEYANQVIFDVAKAFWDERGLGARFRLYKVGTEYLLGRLRVDEWSGMRLEDLVSELSRTLASEGIAEELSTARGEGSVLTVKVKGCIHRPVEERFAAAGVAPFLCPCTNLAMALAERTLDVAAEQACIEVRDDVCTATVVLFKRPVPDASA